MSFCSVLFCFAGGWVDGWDTVMSSLLFERHGRFLNERELLLFLFKNIVWLVVNSSKYIWLAGCEQFLEKR